MTHSSLTADALLRREWVAEEIHFESAVGCGHFDIARRLHEAGVDRSFRVEGWSILGKLIHTATQRRAPGPAIDFLLSICNETFVLQKGNLRLSAIQVAARFQEYRDGRSALSQYILAKILRVFSSPRHLNYQEQTMGWTALHMAVVYGR
jgi:hypothetical protein